MTGRAIDGFQDSAAGKGEFLDPIITMNAGGVIQSASDSVERLFGWTASELFGKNVSVLIPEPRRTALDRYLDRYRQMSRTKSLEESKRFEAVRKDGRLIQIDLSMSRADLPLHGSPFFIGIVHDVSRRGDAGDVPAGDRLRLHRLVTDQTRALATANLRLQMADRLASLGTLAAGLGHDMNNVLLPVRARLNAIESAGITSESLTHLKAVRRSIAYLQHLSDGLHFLAMDPDGPGIASDGEGATDLAPWWTQVGSLLCKAVPKHVTLRVSLSDKLPAVNVAPHWLTQAMLNLIVNAGEAIPKGRRKGVVRVRAELSADGGTIRLEVTDNGRGMSAATQRRAFDLFFTTKSRGMGTGLGLPLARKVALRAGGDVELRSSPGKGTTATLVLPVVPSGGLSRSVAGHTLTAAVSVKDHRTAGMIVQILIGAGARIAAGNGTGPGKADLWVTVPTVAALGRARAWLKRDSGGRVVLVGAPSKRMGSSWAFLGAKIIDPPDDFETMREVLGGLAESKHGTIVKGVHR